jgi:hypothetical protein
MKFVIVRCDRGERTEGQSHGAVIDRDFDRIPNRNTPKPAGPLARQARALN